MNRLFSVVSGVEESRAEESRSRDSRRVPFTFTELKASHESYYGFFRISGSSEEISDFCMEVQALWIDIQDRCCRQDTPRPFPQMTYAHVISPGKNV